MVIFLKMAHISNSVLIIIINKHLFTNKFQIRLQHNYLILVQILIRLINYQNLSFHLRSNLFRIKNKRANSRNA